MKTTQILFAFFLASLTCIFSSCEGEPDDSEMFEYETPCNNERGSLSLTFEDQTFEMEINEKSGFIANEFNDSNYGTVVSVNANWEPLEDNIEAYTFALSLFGEGIELGATSYASDPSSDTNDAILFIYVDEVNQSGFQISSYNFTLDIQTAVLGEDGEFRPIEGSFTGLFNYTDLPISEGRDVNVSGSFCLYEKI